MALERDTAFVYAGVTRWQAGTQNGLFRLAQGEALWERMGQGLPADVFVMCIAVHPQARERVYIGTQFGIFASADHGQSWAKLSLPKDPLQIWSLTVHPTRPQTLLAGSSPMGIYRSDDEGRSWRYLEGSQLPNRIAMGSFTNRIMRIAVDHEDPDAICAAMEVNGTLYSRDGGKRWHDGSDSLVQLAQEPRLKSRILTESDDEGMLDMHAVCTTPAQSGLVIAAGRMGLFRSSDGGAHWQDMRVGDFSEFSYARDIRRCPHDARVFYATFNVSSSGPTGSLWRSADLGQSWTRLDHTVSARSTIMAVATDPRDAQVIHCATRVGQVFGTRDGGQTWQAHPLPEGSLGTYALAGG